MGDSGGHSDDPEPGGRGFGSGASWFRDTQPGERRPPTDADAIDIDGPRAELARTIPRRRRVAWWLGMVLAVVFALLVTPSVTAERWLAAAGAGKVELGKPAPLTVRVAPFAGAATRDGQVRGGGVIVARGVTPDRAQFDDANEVQRARPRGPLPYVAVFLLALVLGAIFTHHMRRSTRGRLLRVQIVSLATIAVAAFAIEIVMLTSALSILVVPVALLAMVPTMVLDRIVGLATGILAALVTALLVPFDVGVAILLLVQASVAGLMVTEQPKKRWRAALVAGGVTTVCTLATYVLLTFLTTGVLPSFHDPLHSPWLAAALGPAVATVLAVPSMAIYQLLVGEITLGKLIALEDLSNPLLRQIAEKAPGTWQHSLMMANLAEIAANAIGASGRLVRVGAYYHDLGKSLQPKYFIENLEPGETSPHDQLPPEVSCDAIFAHVTEGIVTARRAGLHERIVDFMHMHHGNGVLEYFWGKTKEQGNPRGLSIEQFRYPGHPPQSRETAILAICDAVEAASRTLKKPDSASIDALVQRIVYGKLHLGQLDESGLSMSDLRRVSDSLRETIRHANHGRIEYPWQKAQQDASASAPAESGIHPRLDSLDRVPRRDTAVKPVARLADLDDDITPSPRRPSRGQAIAIAETADLEADRAAPLAIVDTAPVQRVRAGRPRTEDSGRQRTEEAAARAAAETNLGRPTPLTRIGQAAGPVPDVITPAMFERPIERAIEAPRTAGPPEPDELDNKVTNPPPLRRSPSPVTRLPALIVDSKSDEIDDRRVTGPRRAAGAPLDLAGVIDEARVTSERPAADGPDPVSLDDARPTLERITDSPMSHGDRVTRERPAAKPAFTVEDASRTEPSLPRFDGPPQPPGPLSSDAAITLPGTKGAPPEWSQGLADRIDKAIDTGDEWGTETPIRPPTSSELRTLLGVPDPTREQSIDELEALHRAAKKYQSSPDILAEPPPPATPTGRTRALPNTAEVDPDDIEAAIEVAPPAKRRPTTAVGIARPKKPE